MKKLKGRFLTWMVSLSPVCRHGTSKKRHIFHQESKWQTCNRRWASSKTMQANWTQRQSSYWRYQRRRVHKSLNLEWLSCFGTYRQHYPSRRWRSWARFSCKMRKTQLSTNTNSCRTKLTSQWDHRIQFTNDLNKWFIICCMYLFYLFT